jgi:DMSO/TMAO reductase YedYZ molybdopterin-dependent catalytic subunit
VVKPPYRSIVPTLTITDGTASKVYTTSDLQKLRQVQLVDKGITYLGVPLGNLLQNSGYDPTTVIAVQALASDGFSASYDQTLIQNSDTLLAYALLDRALGDDEGPFRMVLPGKAGKLNPRMVVKLMVSHP